MIGLDRRAQPVRRVLIETIYGELPSTARAVPACPNKLCVSPNHAMVKSQYDEEPMILTPPPPEECDQDDIMDVVDAVYSRDQPWDPDALAAEFPYPRHLIVEAIRKIEEEGL